MPRQTHTFLRRIKRRKFGELLLSQGTITPEQLEEALTLQRRDGGLLGEIMVHRGFISENEVVRSLSTQYGLPVLRISDYEVDKDVVARFPAKLLYVNLILPLSEIADLILVTVADLPEEPVIEEIEKESGREVVFFVSSTTDIGAALARYAPLSEEEMEGYVSLRRRRGNKDTSAAANDGETGGAAVEERGLFSELDNAWENIFDEAEQNLKKEGF